MQYIVTAAKAFNYDKSNMSKDHGKKLDIYKRRVKFSERATNFSKIAPMFERMAVV